MTVADARCDCCRRFESDSGWVATRRKPPYLPDVILADAWLPNFWMCSLPTGAFRPRTQDMREQWVTRVIHVSVADALLSVQNQSLFLLYGRQLTH